MAMKNDDPPEENQENAERTMKNITVSPYVFDILRGLKLKEDKGTFDRAIRKLFDRVDEPMKEEIRDVIKFLKIKPDTT